MHNSYEATISAPARNSRGLLFCLVLGENIFSCVTLAYNGVKVAVAGRVVWGLRFRLQISITKIKERRKRLCLIQNNK